MSVSPFRPSAALLLLLAARIAEVASPEAAENSLRATGMVGQEQGQPDRLSRSKNVLFKESCFTSKISLQLSFCTLQTCLFCFPPGECLPSQRGKFESCPQNDFFP